VSPLSIELLSAERQAAYQHENAGVFPGKYIWAAAKTMVVDRKKPESTSSAIFGVDTTTKCCELKRCADRVRNRTDKANLNFSPELYRLIFFAYIELLAFHQKDN